MAAQILLFDYVDGAITNDYSMALTFNRSKCPQQICILPSFQLSAERRQCAAICAVCLDGSIELFSLQDFCPITTIEEEGIHFVSVAYCRSLDRLCGSTRNGTLIFYSLNDADNESGDEMLEMEEECNTTLIPQSSQQTNQLNVSSEISVTDGSCPNNAAEYAKDKMSHGITSGNSQKQIDVIMSPSSFLNSPNIKVDCATAQQQSCFVAGSGISQSSPSPSSSSVAAAAAASNLLAYKSSDLTLDDLQTLFNLTQFDHSLTVYSAEVPSCWNDLVNVQKQRKQPQHLRNGDDSQFTKTWRLHNDA